ncbi:MAG: Fumarate hydratase class I, aerobic [Chloroflexi bacterium]|nr:Fumarate hydratase class I, aerobic [Chloroflexota bacterium]MBT9163178.1 Fumarate hydratase class I, aerobic [Chloroflexota bacterium]MBT9166092.1 Fumarate hydratase class I, aerobic [Chloroflexota bacterium]
MALRIRLPLHGEVIEKLRAGDQVRFNGIIYAARDAAHKRLVETLDRGEKLPFEIEGQTIYYMGPSPARPGKVIGSAGPTTSGRMDAYAPRLMAVGLKGMIGKGARSPEVKDAIRQYKAVYFAAIGGAGALIAKSIKKAEIIAYDDLGVEALRRLEVEDFPATVVNDIYGGDLYEEGKGKWVVSDA